MQTTLRKTPSVRKPSRTPAPSAEVLALAAKLSAPAIPVPTSGYKKNTRPVGDGSIGSPFMASLRRKPHVEEALASLEGKKSTSAPLSVEEWEKIQEGLEAATTGVSLRRR